MWEEYFSPGSVNEALEILKNQKGEAQIIAGGTDLVIDVKQGKKDINCVVDINEIQELKKIEQDNDEIVIGGAVTHAQVESSVLVQDSAAALSKAASEVGSPQIRNSGTVAGNIVSAQPAADAAVALFALDAKVEIASQKGTRVIAIDELYEGVGISKINSSSEVITAIRVKNNGSGYGSAFVRFAQRKALALPMLNAAVSVQIKGGKFVDARIAIGPVAKTPFMAKNAEKILIGAKVEKTVIDSAAAAASDEASPRDSALRGSAEYRKKMVSVFVGRAIEQAVKNAES